MRYHIIELCTSRRVAARVEEWRLRRAATRTIPYFSFQTTDRNGLGGLYFLGCRPGVRCRSLGRRSRARRSRAASNVCAAARNRRRADPPRGSRHWPWSTDNTRAAGAVKVAVAPPKRDHLRFKLRDSPSSCLQS